MILRTPQPNRQRATLQPRVPAPNNKHRVCLAFSKSRVGRIRHLINFRLRSTADLDKYLGSMLALRLTNLGATFPSLFFSHPSTLGGCVTSYRSGTLTPSMYKLWSICRVPLTVRSR